MQCCSQVWNGISNSLKKETKMLWNETVPAAEAAEQLPAFVREIRALDSQFEQINADKAKVYRQIKASGFNKAATEAIVNEPSLNDDMKILRQYLELLCGEEAAAAMRDESHFGTILFGQADSWPTEYVDPKHGIANTPMEE